MSDYISREAAVNELRSRAIACLNTEYASDHDVLMTAAMLMDSAPAADVAPVVRLGKDRLTKLGVNGIYGLVKVKDNEQEVDSPHRNTLAAILECFQRLAEYENAEFGALKEEQAND